MMRNRWYLVLAAFTLTTTACITKYEYVTRDTTPGSSVTVIPETMGDGDVSAADHVMSVLLGCGVSVLERPVMLKERSDYRSSGTGVGVGLTGSGGLAIVSGETGKTGEVKTSVDPVALIAETKADYVVIVHSRSGEPTFRIVKKETGQILFAGSLRDEVNPACCLTWGAASVSEEDQARKLLYRIGILK